MRTIVSRVVRRELDAAAAPPAKPLLRGVFHEYAFYVFLAFGAALVASAPTLRAGVAAAVFATTVAAMFGVSALYHRVTWPPRRRRWMRRLDHAAIFLTIAGTYTPYGLLALTGAWQKTVLAVVWTGAALAIVVKLVWLDAPNWVTASIAVAVGWVGVVAIPQLVDAIGAVGFALLAAGGLFYTAGSVVYARRKPDPIPAVFGYHELFHALVIAAVACQYASVALFVLPQA